MGTHTETAAKKGVILLQLGVGVQEYDLPEESTLEDLLREARIDPGQHEIMIDGRRLEAAVVLRPGMIVSLAPRVRDESPKGDWRSTIGMFRDDPAFEEMMKAVEARREAEREAT
jgi:hypothetical protein